MRTLALLPMALWACKDEPAASTETVALDPAFDDDPSEYAYTPEDGTVEPISLDALAAGLDDALRVTLGFTADPVMSAYDGLMAQADSGCPAYYSYDGNSFWYDSCTSDEGATYDGYGFYYAYEDYYDGTYTWNGATFTGLARIEDADGHVFEAGGSAGTIVADYEGWQVVYTTVYGGFSWDGDEATDTWLETDGDPDLYMYGARHTETGGWYAYVEGGASGVSDTLSAVTLNGVLFGDAAGGVTCEIEPIGDLSARDLNGTWYEIDFDAVQSRDNAACDGCGEVTVEGQVLGEVCVDLSNLEEALTW